MIEKTRRSQKTIGAPVHYSGVGIHTGQEVTIRFLPADENAGVFFKRIDLPGQPLMSAKLDYVFDTSRSTNLAKEQARIYTVEHVLAALRAYEIDNVCIELNGIEPPAGNGSSDVFVEMIDKAGVVEQSAPVLIRKIETPVYHSDGDIHLVCLPADEYRISYTLHYPNSKALGTQYHSLVLTKNSFVNELAPCRTFALYEEISYLIDSGLIKGGSLDNAVVAKGDAVLSKGGLFFPNEMVRHKILDLIGDLSLIGIPFTGHIIAVRSGHTTNFHFAKKLFHQLSLESA
jgi:UDP-3-O-[3-hydroxymyristoyl] N-acetylglucosamine deacetylase